MSQSRNVPVIVNNVKGILNVKILQIESSYFPAGVSAPPPPTTVTSPPPRISVADIADIGSKAIAGLDPRVAAAPPSGGGSPPFPHERVRDWVVPPVERVGACLVRRRQRSRMLWSVPAPTQPPITLSRPRRT